MATAAKLHCALCTPFCGGGKVIQGQEVLRQVTLEDLEKRLAAVEKSLEADGEGCAGCWSLAGGED